MFRFLPAMANEDCVAEVRLVRGESADRARESRLRSECRVDPLRDVRSSEAWSWRFGEIDRDDDANIRASPRRANGPAVVCGDGAVSWASGVAPRDADAVRGR